MTDLAAKFESVQELKREYPTNSLNAWKYLKVREAFEDLSDRIKKYLDEQGIKYTPSHREVSNLCQYARSLFSSSLDASSAKRAKALGFVDIPKNHLILAYHPLLDRRRDIEEPESDNMFKTWKFDYEEFIKVFFVRLNEDKKHEVALRTAFAKAHAGSHPYLEDSQGKYSFEEFAKQDRFLLSKLVMDSENKEVIENIEYQISAIQRWIFGLEQELIPDRFYPNHLTQEESDFLFGLKNNPYERAVREKTLRKIETERRVASSAVLQYQGTPYEKDIEHIVKEQKRKLRSRLERLKKLQRLNAPLSILKNEEELIDKAKYTIKAINVNKKWLKRILGINS